MIFPLVAANSSANDSIDETDFGRKQPARNSAEKGQDDPEPEQIENDTRHKTGSRRQDYIQNTLKLNHDPFAYSTAELELQQFEKDPPFFSYFVHPPYHAKFDTEQETLLDLLKQPSYTFVYGADGCGKTTLRYMLEAFCRFVPDRTLTVACTLGKEGPTAVPPMWEEKLNRELATDLFVQIVEQFHRHQYEDVLDAELTEALAQYWRTSIPHFRRNLRRHLEQGTVDKLTGISVWWATWQRAVVRYTALTPPLNTFLQSLLRQDSKASEPKPSIDLQLGLSLAQQVGYKRIFFLVDAVDAPTRASLDLAGQVKQLLAFFASLKTPIPLYPKWFIPERLSPTIQETLNNLPLTPISTSAIIKWNRPDALLQIIENRFRSAGSWIEGFDAIAAKEIAPDINHLLVQSAHHSPRRLLQLVSALIDAHLENAESSLITATDWQEMRRRWSYGPPLPTPLLQ